MSARGKLVRGALRSRAARSVIAVAGVATSTLLVLVLVAGYRGIEAGVRGYAGQPAIDLWIAPRGTDNLVRSSALLPSSTVAEIQATDGVAEAAPLLRGFVAARAGSVRINLLAMGYRGPRGLGGPPVVAAGRPPEGANEIALDRAAAYRLGVGPGDEIAINDRPLRVVGLTRGTNLLATSFAFLDGTEAERASGMQGKVSFVVARLEPGASPRAVARAIEARDEAVVVYGREQWVRNNLVEVTAGVRPIQLLVSAIGVLAATVLVALLAQGLVDDRRRDIAVLFALGAGARVTGVAIVWQAARIALLGVLAGGAINGALVAIVARTLPTVELVPAWTDVASVVTVFALASVLAALVPLWRLRRIDPVEAFRP